MHGDPGDLFKRFQVFGAVTQEITDTERQLAVSVIEANYALAGVIEARDVHADNDYVDTILGDGTARHEQRMALSSDIGAIAHNLNAPVPELTELPASPDHLGELRQRAKENFSGYVLPHKFW